MDLIMKSKLAFALLLSAFLGLSACSSYPSWVPDWAQIGADSDAS